MQSYQRTYSFVSALMPGILHIIMFMAKDLPLSSLDSCTVYEFPKGSGSLSKPSPLHQEAAEGGLGSFWDRLPGLPLLPPGSAGRAYSFSL